MNAPPSPHASSAPVATSPTFSFSVPAAPAPLPRTRSSKALWLIGAGLLANAAVMLYTHVTGHAPDLVLDRAALAQAPGAQPLGARGIYMMPAQLGAQAWGLYLMDVDSGTICVYRALPESSHLRLMAARSFRHDRFLEDFNNESLRPAEVQKIVENQRQRQELKQKDDIPTVDQNPKPDANLPDTPAMEVPKP